MSPSSKGESSASPSQSHDRSPPAKRHKFSRSRTACLQCRQRKSKCGALPPAPCPNCVEAELPCAWPTEDGRSSKARLQRYRNAQLASVGRVAGTSGIGSSSNSTSTNMLAEGWLDRLLTSGAASLAAPPPGISHSDSPGLPPDPAQLVWAVSSRLPTVEDASPADPEAPRSATSPADSKTVKVSWWRPHGQTALTPGLKKYTLRVRVAPPAPSGVVAVPKQVRGEALIGPDGSVVPDVMRHLIEVFVHHFGCQFPFINAAELGAEIEAGTASVFLLLAIAAVAARFSNHPAIALPGLEPYAYGNVFYERAKALLGSMLGLPRRETVAAFVLLAHMGFAADSESEVWMLTGCAVRMAIDCGLHVAPPDDAPEEERRRDRLVFWSVLLMDYALAFGVGRQTAFRPDDITQAFPSDEDVRMTSSSQAGGARSPFPFAARMMLAYGPLINALNRAQGGDAHAARADAIKEYNRLPEDMTWNVTNLQRHSAAHNGPIFLHLHLWMHTVIASGFLTGSSLLSRAPAELTRTSGGNVSGATTPSTSSLWRNSARTIGDILVLSDIINPHAYFALPFVNQAFFVAGCCYVKEIEQQQVAPSDDAESADLQSVPEDEEDMPAPGASTASTSGLSRALLTTVATTNISTLQQGLAKLARYWYGAEWIAGALKQRVDGIRERDVDLEEVREHFESHVVLPDGGVVRAAQVTPRVPDEGVDFAEFLSLPFDLVEGVVEDVPIEQLFGWR